MLVVPQQLLFYLSRLNRVAYVICIPWHFSQLFFFERENDDIILWFYKSLVPFKLSVSEIKAFPSGVNAG